MIKRSIEEVNEILEKVNKTLPDGIIILTGDPGQSARRDALMMFYERHVDDFTNAFERLLFIQCFAALDASEGHNLAGIYMDEFNRTLIEYQKVMEA